MRYQLVRYGQSTMSEVHTTPTPVLPNQQRPEAPHVVIVGGGFGGLTAAKALKRAPVRITLVDRWNHHLFQPLLYQVAMAGLSPAEIAAPIRGVLRKQDNVQVWQAMVSRVDLQARQVELGFGDSLAYDYLILAAGAKPTYYGHDEWQEHTIGLKSLDDAVSIRRRVLLAFEAAEREADPERREQLLTFVIIGGGPTGVELAGSLAELSSRVLARDYRTLKRGMAKVVLVEMGDRVLGGFDEKLSASAKRQLEDLGVSVELQQRVTSIDESGVELQRRFIPSTTVIWAAGVEGIPLGQTLGVELDRSKRVIVNDDCSIPNHPNVFAIGDMAYFKTSESQVLPGVSPVAMQQGRHVARMIQASIQRRPRSVFRYLDKGMMATIGRSRAVAQSGPFRLHGLLAWLAWLFVHLWYLVSFRNRVFVLMQWFWAYVFYRPGARLITGGLLPPNPRRARHIKPSQPPGRS